MKILRTTFLLSIIGASSLTSMTLFAATEEILSGEGILFWTPERQITGYRSIDQIYNTRVIESGNESYPLIPAHQDLSAFRYSHLGKKRSLDDYMVTENVAGLIAIHKGRVIVEKYALGNDEHSKWISFSVAKSVVSMLFGAAIKDGYILSVEDPVTNYLPHLKGSGYDGVTVKNILQMSSGIRWNEDYADPQSDVVQAPGGTLPLISYLSKLPRIHKPGEVFNYNSGETNIAGALLRAAIGNNLSTYLSRKIWQPFGMESDASWLLETQDGVEFGGCCINATLRDYARIGMFALKDGMLPNRQRVLPLNWMRDATSASAGSKGYGYYWWLYEDGQYAADGIFSQVIWIDPKSESIIAMHSAWPVAGSNDIYAHRSAFLKALLQRLSK